MCPADCPVAFPVCRPSACAVVRPSTLPVGRSGACSGTRTGVDVFDEEAGTNKDLGEGVNVGEADLYFVVGVDTEGVKGAGSE